MAADAICLVVPPIVDTYCLSGSRRYKERKDPEHRPAGAVPVEFILLGYPVLDLPPLPAVDTGADSETDDDVAAEGLAAPG